MKKNNQTTGRSASLSASPPESGLRHPLDWPAASGAVGDVLQAMQTRLTRRRRHRRLTGATVALLVLGSIGLIATRKPTMDLVASVPSAIVSRPERQVLADGSVVERRSDVRLTVGFSDLLRRVVLERGEAHFEVAHDLARPFVVSAGGVEFRAVGTAFTVALGEEKVEMFVTEGRVAVEAAAKTTSDDRSEKPVGVRPEAPTFAVAVPPNVVVVEANNHVVIEVARPRVAVPAVRLMSEIELRQRQAWRAPKLEFSGTPLAEAIELIHRHAGREQKSRLVLGDPSLASVRISGILRADNVEVLLAVLEADYGIRSERRGGDEIVLQSARYPR